MAVGGGGFFEEGFEAEFGGVVGEEAAAEVGGGEGGGFAALDGLVHEGEEAGPVERVGALELAVSYTHLDVYKRQALEGFGEEAFGFVLRDHQRAGEGAVGGLDLDVGDFAGAVEHAGAFGPHAGGDEIVGDGGAVEEFEGAGPDDEGLGLVGGDGALVNNSAGEAEALEFDGEGQADGAGADDEAVNRGRCGHLKLKTQN